ncbi:hypothetical protein [Streptomyces sp. NPDC093094]|uniref:hypothetical protein n=1 Tax=Streptomyces sp. NPDC093094 TaxID=3366026 RepID=UPI0037F93CFA
MTAPPQAPGRVRRAGADDSARLAAALCAPLLGRRGGWHLLDGQGCLAPAAGQPATTPGSGSADGPAVPGPACGPGPADLATGPHARPLVAVAPPTRAGAV